MQAMKQFSNWEAREERKFQADLLQEQRGVLFVGDSYVPPPPDATTGVLHITANPPLGGPQTPRPKRTSAFATARRQDKKKSIVLPLPSSVQNSAPEQLQRTMSRGKEVADKGAEAGKQQPQQQLSLKRSSGMLPEPPADSKADAPTPSSTEGDAPLTTVCTPDIFLPMTTQLLFSR